MKGNFFGGAFFGGGFFGQAGSSGVKRKPKVIRLSDLKESDRLSTAEYLKRQLQVQFPDIAPLEEIAQKKAQVEKSAIAKREAKMREDAAAQEALAKAEQERIVTINNQIIALILSSLDDS